MDEFKEIIYNLSRGELSSEDIDQIEYTLEKYGVDFSYEATLKEVYDDLVVQPGDTQEWADDSNLVYEFVIDRLNLAFASIDNVNNLKEVDEDLAHALSILERIEFL